MHPTQAWTPSPWRGWISPARAALEGSPCPIIPDPATSSSCCCLGQWHVQRAAVALQPPLSSDPLCLSVFRPWALHSRALWWCENSCCYLLAFWVQFCVVMVLMLCARMVPTPWLQHCQPQCSDLTGHKTLMCEV